MKKKWLRKITLATGVGIGIASVGCDSVITSCVAKGSWILTPKGLKRVEDLKVGDLVISINEETYETESSPILEIQSAQREVGQFVYGSNTLSLTSDHPIYDPLTREYAPAGDWFLGKRTTLALWKEDALHPLEISEVQSYHSVKHVFDFTVESSFHNFIANDILVHNKSPKPPPYLDRLMGGQAGGGMESETGGSMGGETGGSMDGETGGSMGGETGGSMGGETGGSMGGEMGGQTEEI